MMPERGVRQLGGRRAVRISGRTQRRIAHRGDVDLPGAVAGERMRIPQSRFGEEVVRMLAVHYRLSEGGFSGLKQLRVFTFSDGRGVKAERPDNSEGAPGEGM